MGFAILKSSRTAVRNRRAGFPVFVLYTSGEGKN
jgi:hypothetical protein